MPPKSGSVLNPIASSLCGFRWRTSCIGVGQAPIFRRFNTNSRGQIRVDLTAPLHGQSLLVGADHALRPRVNLIVDNLSGEAELMLIQRKLL